MWPARPAPGAPGLGAAFVLRPRAPPGEKRSEFLGLIMVMTNEIARSVITTVKFVHPRTFFERVGRKIF